ncbi:MAG: cytochrome P450 [Leptolyngbyaceae cyanobacterium SL_5_9]|nr:cytochrome P450 [Leptolyngbyaceae cyanobacterium SL_5_9]
MTSIISKPPQPMSTPSGYPIIGHALDYRLDPLKFYTRCAQEYGDFVQLHFGPHPVYFLNHPGLIKEVFVTQAQCFMERAEGREVRFFDPLFGNGLATSRGSFWQRQRKLMQPAFHRNRLASYGNLAAELTQQRSPLGTLILFPISKQRWRVYLVKSSRELLWVKRMRLNLSF